MNMEYLQIKKQIENTISENLDELIAYSDDLAAHPEISGEEFETSKKIVTLLREKGFEVETPYAGFDTAFKATFGSGRKHKAAILTEYDALPGLGHACGHCVSGAISLLAGIALKNLQDELDCDICIIGTPQEETSGAKCFMVDQGIFDDYDIAMMIHMYNRNMISCGMPGIYGRYITFHGRAAHAASAPWDGINALNAAQLFMHAIDCYRQQTTPDVRLHGVYRDGGRRPNIIPDNAEVELYIRALSKKTMDMLDDRVSKMIEGACLMTGATADVEVREHDYECFTPNETGNAVLAGVYEELGLEVPAGEQSFGSSDIANVSRVCPAFHPTLKIAAEGTELHTKEFEAAVHTDTAHKAIGTGAEIIALQMVKIFSDEEILRKMHEDFERSRS